MHNYKTKYLFDDYSILLIPLTKCVNDYNIHKGNFIKYFKVACKNYLIDSKKYKDDDIKIDYNSEALSKIQVNDIKEEDIPFLAESAFNDACTPGNPRDCTLEEIADIYKSMFR